VRDAVRDEIAVDRNVALNVGQLRSQRAPAGTVTLVVIVLPARLLSVQVVEPVTGAAAAAPAKAEMTTPSRATKSAMRFFMCFLSLPPGFQRETICAWRGERALRDLDPPFLST
jgi:hypothetical protein